MLLTSETYISDVTAGTRVAAISGFLLRSEAVFSSKIEHVDANRTDYAKAMIGLKAGDNARSMVAAADAVQNMIADAGESGEIRLQAMLAAHQTLMKDDSFDAAYAGKFRDVQNWIGGSGYSPRGAIHVPPPPELVAGLMDAWWSSAIGVTCPSWPRLPSPAPSSNPSTRSRTATGALAGP
jgi:Fic family protein